jgi:hypothetical protein
VAERNPPGGWLEQPAETPAGIAGDGAESAASTSAIATELDAETPETVPIAWYASDRQRVDRVATGRRLPIWTGPVRPHLGGDPADPGRAGWWWLGVHGGAGVSSLAEFLPGGADAERCWPDPAFGGPRAVILVCRTHVGGLRRARDAAQQWASADVPGGLLLAGAVAVADAPGKLARPQAEELRLLEGAVPQLWTVPWLEELRLIGDPSGLPLPPCLVRISLDLESLRPAAAVGP